MANHEVEARLCRWLLRARDLSGSDQLPSKQEFLAEMLGVRRTSVTSVARTLHGAGIIKYTRGKIEYSMLKVCKIPPANATKRSKSSTASCWARSLVRHSRFAAAGCQYTSRCRTKAIPFS
jgi:hypothetical protein